MFLSIVSLLVVIVSNDVCLGVGWNPSNFSFNPGHNYELVFADEFENVGPSKAIINGKPAYAPNPKNWFHEFNSTTIPGIQNYTDSIYNAYVQDNQLTFAVLKESNKSYTSARLRSQNLQQFTFGIFAAKIRLPYGQGLCPAWWLLGNADKYNLTWPTAGEIDIVEMPGGNRNSTGTRSDITAHGNVHWNSKSNTMNPVANAMREGEWRTPDYSKLHNNSLVYWTEWTPDNITIGVNEFAYYHFNTTNIPNSINPVMSLNGSWPYFMILNVAVGVGWDGPPDNTTVWPQYMVVDWVRVYQQKKTIIDK